MNSKKYKQIIQSQSEILLFGKFKHCTIQHVLRTEPSYILWLNEENIVQFPQSIIDDAENLALDDGAENFDHNYSSYYDD